MRFALLFPLVLIASACGGAQVNILNQSSTPLQDFTVEARGALVEVKAVGPKSGQRTSICPKGEAGALQVSFKANGRSYRSEQALYFECNPSYEISVDVSPGFEVSATVSLK